MKKSITSDKITTRVISKGALVTLRARGSANSKESLYLDYYVNGKRHQKFLKLYLLNQPKTQLEKEHNKETIRFAENVKSKTEIAISAETHEIKPAFKQNISFIDFFEDYNSNYLNKDKRLMLATLGRLKTFNKDKDLLCSEVTEDMLIRFKDYLQKNLNGETPFNYFKKLKKVIKQAQKSGLIKGNPAEDVKMKHPDKDKKLKKEILTEDEIQALVVTDCQNLTIKKAFLFSYLTGLRFVDVKSLKWVNIRRDGALKLEQAKTEGEVLAKLNQSALELAGERKDNNQLVFPDLPSANGCNKTLLAWVKRAKIKKHISWHCARHSFGVQLDNIGTNLQTIMDLMGHNDIRQTLKYRRYNKLLAEEAVNKLPTIKL